MIREELHRPRHQTDALSNRPARPHFDAVEWKAAKAREAETIEAAAALLAEFERNLRPAVAPDASRQAA